VIFIIVALSVCLLLTTECVSGMYLATILAAVRQLVNLFLLNGYALGGSVSMTNENGTKIVISLNSPATLWGGKILQSEGAKLSNNFLLKAATELIKRAGYSSSSSVKYDATSEDITISIG
jgi:hypothetical protein